MTGASAAAADEFDDEFDDVLSAAQVRTLRRNCAAVMWIMLIARWYFMCSGPMESYSSARRQLVAEQWPARGNSAGCQRHCVRSSFATCAKSRKVRRLEGPSDRRHGDRREGGTEGKRGCGSKEN